MNDPIQGVPWPSDEERAKGIGYVLSTYGKLAAELAHYLIAGEYPPGGLTQRRREAARREREEEAEE